MENSSEFQYEYSGDVNMEDDYVNPFWKARQKIEELWDAGYDDIELEVVVKSNGDK